MPPFDPRPPPRTIRQARRRALEDGVISRTEAELIARVARSGGQVTRSEQVQLRDILNQDRFEDARARSVIARAADGQGGATFHLNVPVTRPVEPGGTVSLPGATVSVPPPGGTRDVTVRVAPPNMTPTDYRYRLHNNGDGTVEVTALEVRLG